jgi:acyl carrier protein
METILNQVVEIIRETLDDKHITPRPQTKVIDLKGWGSLKHIQFIASVENHFQIRFAFQEMMNWETIADLVKIIEKKQADL